MNGTVKPKISIVIPFYNEEDCVKFVIEELLDVMPEAFGRSWEIIMVDDGSSDGTARLINDLSKSHHQLHSVHITPNCGQSSALEAGFTIACGHTIGTLDGDGQNDPRDFHRLLQEMEKQGVDMMCGVRAQRADTFVRKISSRIANGLRSLILKDNISDVGCSIRLFRRECLSRILLFKNAHRFFPALIIMAGYTVSQMPVNHRPRLKGLSKYGRGINTRLWVGIVDLAGVYWLKKRMLNYSVRMNGESKDETREC